MLGERKQQVTRQRIVFNQLRAPFTVGGGKFRLKDAYMNGPMLGATLRGTVDFKAQTVELGGTYVPLYGLNSALGAIPILGRVLVGRQGEGVVGITFAIKGKLDDPSVLVNPMSVMTPGIFRQIFEFTGSVPDQTPRRPPPPSCSPARPSRPARNRRGAHTGRIRACRFLPSESLITPSSVRSAEVRSCFSSDTGLSFTLRPPPLT